MTMSPRDIPPGDSSSRRCCQGFLPISYRSTRMVPHRALRRPTYMLVFLRNDTFSRVRGLTGWLELFHKGEAERFDVILRKILSDMSLLKGIVIRSQILQRPPNFYCEHTRTQKTLHEAEGDLHPNVIFASISTEKNRGSKYTEQKRWRNRPKHAADVWCCSRSCPTWRWPRGRTRDDARGLCYLLTWPSIVGQTRDSTRRTFLWVPHRTVRMHAVEASL